MAGDHQFTDSYGMINYEAFHQKPLGQKGINNWNMKHETFGIRRKVGF